MMRLVQLLLAMAFLVGLVLVSLATMTSSI
jgi:hypothetical protein